MTFGLDLSLRLFVSDNVHQQQHRSTISTERPQSETLSGQRSTNLPRSTSTVQRLRSREQRERELQADRESLCQLEAALATNSEAAAKPLDRQSLAVLERVTRRSEGDELQRRWSTDTPPSAWKYPIIHQLRGIGSDAGRWGSLSPSSRPPPSSRSASAGPTMETEATHPGFRGTKDLTAELAAAATNAHSLEKGKEEIEYRQAKTNSLHKWFERLETKDAEEDWNGMANGFSGSVGGTPRLSPETEDGEETGTRGRRMGRDEMPLHGDVHRSSKGPQVFGSKKDRSKGRKECEGHLFDGKSWVNQLSDDEDWVNVHYFSDDS